MAKKNAINNKSGELTIDPGASGDSFVQHSINGTPEFRIGVDDTDDSFRISQGSALGTNDTFVMTAAGQRTMPLQPAFLAKNSTDRTDVTGDGTSVSIVPFETEIFDQGGDYDNGTYTFTAPITGRYAFVSSIMLQDLTASHTRGIILITTSNREYYLLDINAGVVRNSNNDLRISNSIIADMDAADTAVVTVNVQNGTKVVDIFGDGTATSFTSFSGYLIC